MATNSKTTNAWMSPVLRIAGVYNIAWGVWTMLFPAALWKLLDMPQPNYPEVWQCVGMIVGVYGIGYWIAAGDPVRHWPIVLVGLLGKVLGPIGLLQAAIEGRLPWRFGLLNIANDLIWWVPFTLILVAAYRWEIRRRTYAAPDIRRVSLRAKSQFGVPLIDMSNQSPVLVVFLRHFGCNFCREALADLAQLRTRIASAGTSLVLVHMGTEEEATEFLGKYDLGDVPRVSDPKCELYRGFGLGRGSLSALSGPKVWLRAAQAGAAQKEDAKAVTGDRAQMPGVFLIFYGEVLGVFRHQSISDRPDYLALALPRTLT